MISSVRRRRILSAICRRTLVAWDRYYIPGYMKFRCTHFDALYVEQFSNVRIEDTSSNVVHVSNSLAWDKSNDYYNPLASFQCWIGGCYWTLNGRANERMNS